MKQYLIAIAMMLTLSTSANALQPKHRHHYSTEAAAVKADTVKSQGVEAYSDTTSVAEDESAKDSMDAINDAYNRGYNAGNDKEYGLENVFGSSAGLAIVFGCLVAIAFILAPVIIVVLIIKYLTRRNRDKAMIAQQAVANGQPIPDEPKLEMTDEASWRDGVKKLAIGAGLIIFFWSLGAESLAGIGALVACIGLGKMYIAKHSMKKNEEKDNDRDINA